jgi:hypothetical protein
MNKKPIPETQLIPTILPNSTVDKNTHGVSFLKNRITLYSVDSEDDDINDLKILNGSFADIPHYEEVIKKYRQILASLEGLRAGAENIITLLETHPDLSFDWLLTVYDYHRVLDKNESKYFNPNKITEKQVFEVRQASLNAYSVNLRKGLKLFALLYCSDKFTKSQLDQLRRDCGYSENSTNNKRGHDNDDDDNDNDEETKKQRQQ